MAIHAGKNRGDIEELIESRNDARRHDFYDGNYDRFLTAIHEAVGPISKLPLGCVLGLATLKRVVRAETIKDPGPFGDFSPGRFAWQFEKTRTFSIPIEATGALGIWTWEQSPGVKKRPGKPRRSCLKPLAQLIEETPAPPPGVKKRPGKIRKPKLLKVLNVRRERPGPGN